MMGTLCTGNTPMLALLSGPLQPLERLHAALQGQAGYILERNPLWFSSATQYRLSLNVAMPDRNSLIPVSQLHKDLLPGTLLST